MLPLKIKTCESASMEDLKTNILTNLDLIDTWVGANYTVREGTANIVSFGRSFQEDPQGLIDKMGKENPIFTVKHCLPLFKDLDVKPKYAVMLDPREALGTSTLGYKRADLFEVYPETTYLVASMTHPSVTRLLKDKGANVVGWHSACEAIKDPQISGRITEWITGGSCSALRAISLARVFGYRKINLGGLDAVVKEPEDYIAAERDKVATLVENIGLDISIEQFDKLFKEFIPAIELYDFRKNARMLGPEAQNTRIQVLEHVQSADDKKKLEFMRINIGDNIMWCTPELAAIAQDMERIFLSNTDVEFANFSGGVCGAMWDLLGGAAKINPQDHKLVP